MVTTSTVTKDKKLADVLRLTPRGDLVASSVEEERASLLKALESAKKTVVLDLSPTEQVDSLGITLILGLYKSCQKRGITFSVEGAKADIIRVFKLFSLTKLFAVSEA